MEPKQPNIHEEDVCFGEENAKNYINYTILYYTIMMTVAIHSTFLLYGVAQCPRMTTQSTCILRLSFREFFYLSSQHGIFVHIVKGKILVKTLDCAPLHHTLLPYSHPVWVLSQLTFHACTVDQGLHIQFNCWRFRQFFPLFVLTENQMRNILFFLDILRFFGLAPH